MSQNKRNEREMLKITIKPKIKNLIENANVWTIKNLEVISHQLQAMRLVVNQDMLTQFQRSVRTTDQYLMIFKNQFGGHFEHFNCKVYLKSIIRPTYQDSFSDKVIKLNEFTRNVIFRTQIIVNNYVVQNQTSSAY